MLALQLTFFEGLGILGAAASGLAGVVAAWVAVRKAKQETRAVVEHECLERIERMRLGAFEAE